MAAAKCILMLCNQGALVEFGGYISITKSLALSLMRASFEGNACTVSKSKQTPSDFKKLKKLFMSNM